MKTPGRTRLGLLAAAGVLVLACAGCGTGATSPSKVEDVISGGVAKGGTPAGPGGMTSSRPGTAPIGGVPGTGGITPGGTRPNMASPPPPPPP